MVHYVGEGSVLHLGETIPAKASKGSWGCCWINFSRTIDLFTVWNPYVHSSIQELQKEKGIGYMYYSDAWCLCFHEFAMYLCYFSHHLRHNCFCWIFWTLLVHLEMEIYGPGPLNTRIYIGPSRVCPPKEVQFLPLEFTVKFTWYNCHIRIWFCNTVTFCPLFIIFYGVSSVA